jgi:hypothetical protein
VWRQATIDVNEMTLAREVERQIELLEAEECFRVRIEDCIVEMSATTEMQRIMRSVPMTITALFRFVDDV